MWKVPERVALSDDPQHDMVWALTLAGGTILGLDPISLLIWETADGAEGLDVLLNRLHADNGWDISEIRDHVAQTVTELARHGLLNEVEEA